MCNLYNQKEKKGEQINFLQKYSCTLKRTKKENWM